MMSTDMTDTDMTDMATTGTVVTGMGMTGVATIVMATTGMDATGTDTTEITPGTMKKKITMDITTTENTRDGIRTKGKTGKEMMTENW